VEIGLVVERLPSIVWPHWIGVVGTGTVTVMLTGVDAAVGVLTVVVAIAKLHDEATGWCNSAKNDQPLALSAAGYERWD